VPNARNHGVEIRPLEEDDREWVERFVRERWGSPVVVAHGTRYLPRELPGLLALEEGEPVGLLTYSIEDDACEIVTIDSVTESKGVGTALVEAAAEAARAAGCRRLWLITTNDNLRALRFYQKRGFSLVAVHAGAVTEARKLKREIPLVGFEGIPLRDELELGRDL
jgi:GNAT superfamily N-acetyltransferase